QTINDKIKNKKKIPFFSGLLLYFILFSFSFSFTVTKSRLFSGSLPPPLPKIFASNDNHKTKMETTAHSTNNVTPPTQQSSPGADESHGGAGGVFVCNKCGWHFPNQNPSSRHRRAHRKICGTIPGYSATAAAVTLPVSPPQLQTFYSFVSADDHPSDDDGEFKTPSPGVLERSQMEIGSGGKSSRPEDEVFSDAVTDFVDAAGSSSTLGLQQHLEEGFKGVVNHKDIEGPVVGSSDETTQIHISEVEVHPERVAPASEEDIPIAATEFTGRSNLDVEAKEPGDTGLVPLSDLNHMIPRNQINDPGEVTMNSINDLSDTYQENGETTPEVHGASGLDLSGDNDVKLSEGMANIEKTVVVNLNTGGISKLDDENTAKPASGCGDGDKVGELHQLELDEKIETNSSPDGMQSNDHINASVDKVDKEDVPVVADFASSNESEGWKCTDDGNAHVLSVNGDITYADNAEALITGFKGEGIKVLKSVKSGSETIDLKASEPSIEDLNCIVLPARPLDEGTLLTSPVVQVVGDSLEVKGESSQLVPEVLLDVTEGEDTLLCSPDVPVVGDNLEVKGESSKLVAKVLVDGTEIKNPATDVSCIGNESLGEMEFSADTVGNPVQSPEEQIGDRGDAILVGSNLDSTAEVPSEVPAVEDNFEVKGDSSKFVTKALVDGNEGDNLGTDISCIASERLGELGANAVVTPVRSPEEQIGDLGDAKLIESNLDSAAEVSPDPRQQISSADNREGEQLKRPDDSVPDIVANNEGSNVDDDSKLTLVEPHEDKNRSTAQPCQLDRPDVTETENSDPSTFVDQNVSTKQVETLDSDTEHRRSDIDVSKQRSQEGQHIESNFLEGVSSTDSEGNKIDRNVPPAAKIGGITSDAEVSQKSNKDAGVVRDECTRDLVGDVSDDKPELFSKDQIPAKHVNTSAADISVDSISQTDSLEGQWGSVSAVSVDAEGASGGGSGKNSKKMTNERQETDMFEAPSFMTLVEQKAGGGASESKAGASPAQAGWFPSITNVVNESEGRKKNEAIIAKVTTNRTQLKSLLGEANEETKKENTGGGGEVRRMQEEGVVAGKEWSSSPDREEKRKVKGKPYWTHLVCCASVN
ncbi:hypothetical protein LINGRAHAP2_LOCUS19789, partial [Linum grandiflorum]